MPQQVNEEDARHKHALANLSAHDTAVGVSQQNVHSKASIREQHMRIVLVALDVARCTYNFAHVRDQCGNAARPTADGAARAAIALQEEDDDDGDEQAVVRASGHGEKRQAHVAYDAGVESRHLRPRVAAKQALREHALHVGSAVVASERSDGRGALQAEQGSLGRRSTEVNNGAYHRRKSPARHADEPPGRVVGAAAARHACSSSSERVLDALRARPGGGEGGGEGDERMGHEHRGSLPDTAIDAQVRASAGLAWL